MSNGGARVQDPDAMPSVAAVVRELKSLGKPNTAKIYGRHGVREKSVGLSYADLGKLTKRLGVDHELALGLWKTGIHDARVLATKIADPDAIKSTELDAWIGDATNYVITDAISGLAARSPNATRLAKKWMKSRDEWKGAAGYGIVSVLAVDGRVDGDLATEVLDRVEAGIHRAKNRTRHSMNNALISIGGSMDELRPRALEVAQAIGTIEVDHGETGCKTPAAAPYIAKMVAHGGKKRGGARKKTAKKVAKTGARRTRVTGSKMAAPDKIEVQNVNVPGRTNRVDRAKYEAMRKALMKVLPKAKSKGLNQRSMIESVKPHLPQDLFPGGEKAGWWVKTVHLDLEAKGKVVREPTKPLTWHRA